jgi:hypothetical protein
MAEKLFKEREPVTQNLFTDKDIVKSEGPESEDEVRQVVVEEVLRDYEI